MGVQQVDLAQAVEMIRAGGRILLVSHTRPDGDALGSQAGLRQMILADAKAAGRTCKVETLVLSEPAKIYDFLLPLKFLLMESNIFPRQVTEGRLNDFDLIILVDTSATRQLPGVGEYLQNQAKNLLVIDHHLAGDIEGQHRLVDTTAAAAGEIVFELSRQGGLPLNQTAAEALFTAVATDTGWFRFENTTAKSLEIAAALFRAGAEPHHLYHRVFENDPVEKLRLTAETLGTLKMHHHGKLATLKISQDMFGRTQTNRSHVENIVNLPQQVSTVAAVVLFVYVEPEVTRCSLRSKGSVDVNRVASHFGGGGHQHAAGATLHCSLEKAQEQVLNAFQTVFPDGPGPPPG